MRMPDGGLARQVLDTLPVGIVVHRKDRVVLANPRARALLRERRAVWSTVLASPVHARTHTLQVATVPPQRIDAVSTRLAGHLRLTCLIDRADLMTAGDDPSLQAQLRTARDVMASQQDFVRMLNHELRTPMTVIDMQAQRLIQRAEPGTDAVRYADRIRQAVATMRDQIESSLTAERMEPDSFELAPRPHHLPDLLLRTTDRIAAGEGEETQIQTIVDTSAPLIPIDTARIVQVINNLIENALKYSPGVRDITVAHRRRPGWQIVEIADRGIGLPDGNPEALFEKFKRGANTRGIPGTGIGLYMVRTIVQRHRGRMWLEPNTPQGTRAIIELPES